MKSRLKITSVMLLFALVVSAMPALAWPTQASAAACYQAQFVADVTVPDGTQYTSGTAFKKTWRLKNTGTCAWTTSDSMIFDSGAQMGGPASVAMPSAVATGATVDISVNLTAPNAAGHYIGYWKFKSSTGTVFGIGVNANKAWWVEINVPSNNTGGVVYDFAATADKATWTSGAGGLTFPGTEGDAKGFAIKKDKPKYESGVVGTQPALLFVPQNITNGFIQARFPSYKVDPADKFQTTVGCEAGATTCYVAYRLDYEVAGVVKTFWSFRERYEGLTYNASISLAPLAGKDVSFILFISAYGSPAGDRALWGNPVIVRPGIVPPPVTGTPPTATATNTPGPITPTVPPSACDKVQFIADVNIPDGTVLQPGAQFTKTWKLKNVGTCAWTKSYQLVFFSGEKMGAASSAAFPQDVAVGTTVNISINMVAPSAAGSYRGYWMFKNANGALFGLGAQGNKPWWVDIKVAGPTVTPGGPTATPSPTATPGGPTVTPSAGTAYDFAANVCNGTWFSAAGQLPCPGSDGDAKGFVLKVNNARLETGATDPRGGLITFPQNVQNGYIQGFYPPFKVQAGDRFQATIGCEGGATNCYVAFRLDFQTGTDPIKTIWGPFLERYEGQVYPVDIDLSTLAGKDVKFILTVLSAGSATGDRAQWVAPRIYRAGGTTNLPDLTINSVVVDLQNPGCLLPDARYGLRVSISNKGQAAAGSFVVKSGDLQETVNSLAAGETKAVFLANYVSSIGDAVTATVDATNVIAESNEQNNTFSGQIPVPTQPLPCTATPSPAASIYQNAKYNFQFTLPTGATIAGQSDTVGRVNLPFAAGTNLTEKYLQVNVVEGANPCVNPVMDVASAGTESATISTIVFTKQTGQGIALGNIYDWVAYSTLRNNACISLTFILHSVNPANFPTPPPLFDKNAESAVFDTTISTFNWINP
jgi:Ig-like domain-containing protein/CARDB protein